MSGYRYDDMLTGHLKAAGALGFVAKGLRTVLPKALQFGVGAELGIPIGGAGTAGMVAGQAKDILPSVTKPGVGPGRLGAGAGGPGATNGEQGHQVQASLRENPATYSFKTADWKSVVTPLSYAAMLAGSMIDPSKSKWHALAHYGGELGGLGGLGAVTGSDIHQGKDVTRNALDLAGLALFATAAGSRMHSPPEHH